MILWFLLNTLFLVTALALALVLADKVVAQTLVHLNTLRQSRYGCN